jgi:uncharacterized protein (TIGR00369 family)
MEVNAEILRKMFHTIAPIVKYFGMKLDFDENDQAIIKLPYNPNLDHGEGAIHGGVIATLLDNAGFFTSALANEGIVTTSEMSFHLLRPARKTQLIAKGKVLKLGRRQIVAEMYCYDKNDQLIAHATGTYLNLEKKT